MAGAVKPLLPDLAHSLDAIRGLRNFSAASYIQRKSTLINEYMRSHGLCVCVVGVSGGIDSAVVLGLLKAASKQVKSPIRQIVPVLVSVNSGNTLIHERDIYRRGILVCRSLGMKLVHINLTQAHTTIHTVVDRAVHIQGRPWAQNQLTTYARTPVLYYCATLYAQKDLPAVVCGTTNMDEGSYIGYFSKAADGMVDLQLLSDIHKSEVLAVGLKLAVSKEILQAAPCADRFDGKSDEEFFEFSYDFLELYLEYRMLPAQKQQAMRATWGKKSVQQFEILTGKIERLHKAGLHKYHASSPAVHLDVLNYAMPGGWAYRNWIK